jgi:Hint domain/Right handed beta helix region
MAIITVRPGQSIAAAVAASSAGDEIDVQAGTYTNDFFYIGHSLTLQAIGGEVHILATVEPSNGKAAIVEGVPGSDVTINGFEVSGVAVGDGNGAAIRYEGGNLYLSNDYFHDNQEGLLAGGSDTTGTITIDHSEFARNGGSFGPGLAHNIYVSASIANLTVTNSYIHDANIGHEIKSRAQNTVIENNRIFDNSGTASYSIDLPNAGNATISGNIIEQGAASQNPAIIAYGEEGASNPGTSVAIDNNTIVNDLAGGHLLLDHLTSTSLIFQNNQVYGLTPAEVDSGPLTESGTTFLAARPTLDTSSILCFAAGTKIATPGRERRVEELAVGDLVHTVLRPGEELCPRPMKWIGRRRIDLTAHPHPEMVLPVRIQRGAVADNVPHTDLLVSPDHAILVDGKLICARQLINGITIRQEAGWTSVDYFHVELDGHAILVAEGLPTESYLDTGNRGFFVNSDEPLMLHPDLTDEADYPTREAGSCAPFVWDEANVRPVWQRLAHRAAAIGLPVQQRATTTDPELRVRSRRPQQPDGRPVYQDGNQVIFVLPRGAREIRLISRAQSPTEARPWLEDRRKLGVRVQRIVLRGANELREIPMDHPDLTKGWWDIEREGQSMSRWTNGDAAVPLPAMDGPVMLKLHLAGEMLYAVEVEVPDTELAAA